MRGSTIKVGEYFNAKYYDLIPKIENNKIVYKNGKMDYTIDDEYYEFSFKEKIPGTGSSFFNNYKGFQQKITNIGVFQTSQYNYQIYTSNTEIPFKIGGQVVIMFNGREFRTTIVSIKTDTNYINTLTSQRFGIMDYENMPLVLELN